MPEGDTVHKLAAALAPRLEGRTLVRVELPRLPPGPDLTGRRVEAVRAVGKHLFVDLEGGLTVRSHLGMYGAWHRYPPGERWRKPRWQARAVLETAEEVLVCFNAREVEVLRTDGIRARTVEARLGPDLLGSDFDPSRAVARARELLEPEAPVVDVLLDQRVAAGIGNEYKSELLFLERVPPDTVLGEVSDETLVRLLATARNLLGRNLGGGPRTTRFEADGRGRVWVYGRRGLPCLRCGTPIRYARTGRDLRSTYWCPECQGEP